MLGNIEQESTFNVYNSTGKYIGLYQLSINDRFRNTISWCNKNGYSKTKDGTHIAATCRGDRKSAYGFKWKFKYERN